VTILVAAFAREIGVLIDLDAARKGAKKKSDTLRFSSEKLGQANNQYVAWLDLMGAGHTMSVSVQKSANFIVRLHMACERAAEATNFSGTRVPINDGVFIVSKHKAEIIAMVQEVMALMASVFVAKSAPQDRFLMRGGLAFGPVYGADELTPGVGSNRMKAKNGFLSNVIFGPPIIQAYKVEVLAPPFGIAVHESARSFSEPGEAPFRLTHWFWWQHHKEVAPSLSASHGNLKEVLSIDLKEHFKWMKATLLLHGIPAEKVTDWSTRCDQYFIQA